MPDPALPIRGAAEPDGMDIGPAAICNLRSKGFRGLLTNYLFRRLTKGTAPCQAQH